MAIPLIILLATLLAALVERLPRSDRKIRHEWRRNDKRWVW